MHVRVTGVVVEDNDRILVLNQDTDTGRSWSLPGGKVEEGETIRDALVREMREETGLDVEPGRLLYVCDHLPGGGTHVVHVTFEARRTGGIVGQVTDGLDTRPIRGVEFVKIAWEPRPASACDPSSSRDRSSSPLIYWPRRLSRERGAGNSSSYR